MAKIICANSLEWLPVNPNQGSIITSIPEAFELGIESLPDYAEWFKHAAGLCFAAASEKCPVIFSQTDRKKDGWFHKPHLLQTVAESMGWRLLWAKVELRRAPGAVDLFRPGYRHLVCFGNGIGPGKATEDVIPVGKSLYEDGLCYRAAELAVSFALAHSPRVLDPFSGRGTIPVMADLLGGQGTGVDISEEQCTHARALSINRLTAFGPGALFLHDPNAPKPF